MTKGRPSEGHPPDLALKNNNSIAKIACNLPPNIFGGPGFPMQVQARIKVLSLDVCFAYAKHHFLTEWDDWLLDMIGFFPLCPLASILPTIFAHRPRFCHRRQFCRPILPTVPFFFGERIPPAIKRTIHIYFFCLRTVNQHGCQPPTLLSVERVGYPYATSKQVSK